MRTKVVIIGFGTMGKAITKTITKKDPKISVFSIDKDKPNINNFIQKVKEADFLILATKPQESKEAIGEIKNYLNKKTIIISIMAGVSIKELVHLSGHKKIIRMMPNLGLSVGYGIAAWKGIGISGVEKKKAKNFINKITENFEVKNEDTINKVTAISGSGPAYFFLLADCLMQVCGDLGFNKNESRKLVENTFLASALLAKEDDYSSLVKKVASKGGTTEAALDVFQKENLKGIVSKAVKASYKRAKELSQDK
ncbi:MAG: pyrroline-5-carboxylate reductase dimerization domain-containing protein [Candidatus Paceibacterota bacterium]|jgi:pyrroline-5-carboxylate reductase